MKIGIEQGLSGIVIEVDRGLVSITAQNMDDEEMKVLLMKTLVESIIHDSTDYEYAMAMFTALTTLGFNNLNKGMNNNE